MPQSKFQGKSFRLNGRNYVLPSLSLGQLEDADPLIREFAEKAKIHGTRAFLSVVPLIALAFQRNYPDITEDQVRDFVDLKNFTDIWLAVLGKISDSEVTFEEGE